MIVVSLLLILVAVALLVLGLGAGSSALLISSIVASLLAAVALVVGARRAAGLRAITVFTDEPRPAEYARAHRRDAYPSPPPSAAASSSMPDFAPADVPSFSDAEPPSGPPKSSRFAEASSESPAAAGSGSFAPEPAFAAESSDSSGAPGFEPFAGSAETGSAAADRRDDDVAAPSPGPEASAASAAARSATAEPAVGEPAVGEFGSEEFGSGDDADPADEPPPQAIRPADAVRIARMTTDVFVVDGRPRYHLAECPHLSGLRAEPIPADEAMELCFSPCSLCRPVDQLVAESARR